MAPISHQIETRVTYAETDAMGIVYYANYLRWFEMGRTQLIRHFGTRVKITRRGRRGKIDIEFFSEEDLHRVLDLLIQSSPLPSP